MTFKQSLKVLGIEDYAERIFKSNSKGELFHLEQYSYLADILKDDATWFRDWFERVIEFAEENWERPQSVYQHIFKILKEDIKNQTKQTT